MTPAEQLRNAREHHDGEPDLVAFNAALDGISCMIGALADNLAAEGMLEHIEPTTWADATSDAINKAMQLTRTNQIGGSHSYFDARQSKD